MTIQPVRLLPIKVLLASLLLSPYICAFDTKTPDAQRLLTNSPWAMQVEGTMDDPLDVPEISTAVPTSISQAGQPQQGNGNLGTNTRWDGAIAKTRMGRLATIPVMVRWESAAVIRRALEQQADPAAAIVSASADANFILSVTGLLPANRAKEAATIRPKSSSEDGTQVRSAEETLEWFMGNSLLLVKGQPALRPLNAKVDAATGSVRLFFTRSDTLMAHKQDVLFVTRYGSMSVQAKFRVKNMLVNGKPDL